MRLLFLFLSLVILDILPSSLATKSQVHEKGRTKEGEEFPTCGDCWCVPSNNGTDPCPYDEKPSTEFSSTAIDIYMKQIPMNAYSISCNPYKDKTCQTTPPQLYLDLDTAVCGFIYPIETNKQDKYGMKLEATSCSNYFIQTFPSREEAEAAGAVITHEGSCGLCSTTVDLALYLTQDFTSAGKVCATKGLFNEADGLACYESLGLTPECAKIWNYDGIYDGKACAVDCMGYVNAPNNGPAPACELNPCLQCDEEKAGPIFSAYAGRTRRRSGLMSEIIRTCDSIARNISHNPCTNPACDC